LQDDRVDARLMMPSSRKGRGKKMSVRRPIPIPTSLAQRLRDATAGKAGEEPLLVKPSGTPWHPGNHSDRFKQAVERIRLDPNEVSIYALRHSSIVRQLLAGVPVRVVAVNHDTSIPMIERTYSRYIGDHADALARKALLDIASTPSGNVVPITAAKVSAAAETGGSTQKINAAMSGPCALTSPAKKPPSSSAS
jgi:hypothetical protein